MRYSIFYDLFDAEEYQNFIKSVVKLFRLSPEYNMWLQQCNRSTCAATGMNKFESGADIDVHHYGRTLWDWVEHIVEKLDENNVPFNTFFVLMILAEIHLQNCVSYVPLLHCVHKMLHNDYQSTVDIYPNIENNIFEGDWRKADAIIDHFISLYKNCYNSEEEELTDGAEK